MDEETRINILLASYSLEEILEENDITEEYVLEMLIKCGLINLSDYFEDETE